MNNFDIEKFPYSPTAKRMLKRVSPVYNNAYTAKWLYEVMGQEIDDAWSIMRELRDQEFPETVTWAIDFWEQKFSLKYNPNLTLEERRARLKRKMMFHFPLNPARLEKIIQEGFNIIADVDETYAPGVLEININANGQDLSNPLPLYKELYKTKPSHLSIIVTRHIQSKKNLYFGGAVLLDREIIIKQIPTEGAETWKNLHVGGAISADRDVHVPMEATDGANTKNEIFMGGTIGTEKEMTIQQKGTQGAGVRSDIYMAGAITEAREINIKQISTNGAKSKSNIYVGGTISESREINVKPQPTDGAESMSKSYAGGAIIEDRVFNIKQNVTPGATVGGTQYIGAALIPDKEIFIRQQPTAGAEN